MKSRYILPKNKACQISENNFSQNKFTLHAFTFTAVTIKKKLINLPNTNPFVLSHF